MGVTEIALIVIAAAFCILVVTLVPTALTVKRTVKSIGSLADMVQNELKPTIQEMTGVITELRTVSGGIAEHTDDVKRLLMALGETGTNLHAINRSVGTVTSVLSTTAAWTTGAKVAGKFLLERYLKRRGGKDHV